MKKFLIKNQTAFLMLALLPCLTEKAISQETDTAINQSQFVIHGNVNLNLIGYSINGIPARADPFSAVFSVNATATYKDFEIPMSLVVSPMAFAESHYSQSFNQFGMSPKWRWITFHAGYRNITFSNFTLAGHTFLGGGIELKPGIFRFGFIYGKFNRKTIGSTINSIDNLPQFARKGFAAKIGVGSEKNFFDLIFLRIRDDSTTLQQADTVAITTPAQNTVAGINSHFTFSKKLTLDLEGALSLYTNNLGATAISEIEDDKTLRSVNKFFVINLSSEYYYAIRSSLQYKEKYWSLKLEYKRIEPRYRSMGAYFFNNDLEKITLNPSFTLFKRKLSVSGGIGLQQDNLRNIKRAATIRSIGNVNISCNPIPKFGFSTSYSNYSINQKAGRLALNDTTRVRQASHNFSFSPRVFLIKSKMSHMIILAYNLASINDKNDFTSDFTHFTSQITQLNYILGLLKSKWSFTSGFTYTTTSNFLAIITGIGGTIGVSKSILKDKLSISFNNSLTRTNNEQTKGWVYNSNLSSNYRVDKHHNLRLYIFFTGDYPDPGSNNPSFNEFKGDLSYVYTF